MSGAVWLLIPIPHPNRDGVSDLLAKELYLTMLSMAAMMKNIRMGSRRMYWDRVRHPVSEKQELAGQMQSDQRDL